MSNRSHGDMGSKMDSAVEERSAEMREAARQRGLAYFEISAVAHQGLDPLLP